jgi:hypothetical protein
VRSPSIHASICAVVLSLATASPAQAGSADGYGATFVGQSAFVTATPGATASFVAAFYNDGARAWDPGVVGLLVCTADGVCGSLSPNQAYARGWFSSSVYATPTKSVAPGEVAFFGYQIVIPADAEPGATVAFDGAVGLIATGVAFGGAGHHEEVAVPAPGVAARLTVSGNDSPRPAGDRAMIGVDIDDVWVELVGDDDTTVVTASLDPASCSGASAGDAYLEAATRQASQGRAWFTVRSLAAYQDCTLTVSAPGLKNASTTITFAAGVAAGLACSVSPSILDHAGAVGTAVVSLTDIYGNSVIASDLFDIALSRASGEATKLLTSDDRATMLGSAFFFVQAVRDGTDVYNAHLSLDSDHRLSIPATNCAIQVGR